MESGAAIANSNGHVEVEGGAQLDPYSPFEKVTLGKYTYTVYEQRVGHLDNKLKRIFGQLVVGEVNSTDDLLATLVTGPAYRILQGFIPRIMPEWEFRGYVSQEAFERGEYDEDADVHSPGPTQIRRAIETAMRVNSIDLFVALKDFFSTETRHAIVDELVLKGIELLKKSGLPQQNASALTTAGPSTTSGMTDPTPASEPQTDDSNSD